jgi:hypothetical protein
MSMNPEQEQFEGLRRLLALKRFEQPPPGFFDRFSREVIQRIKAGERGDPASTVDRLFAEPRWLQRILAAFEEKPAVAGAFGLAMCALLVSGVFYSENVDTTGAAFMPPAEPMPGAVVNLLPHPPFAQDRVQGVGFSTGSRLPLGQESLFEEFKQLHQSNPAAASFLAK